MHSFTCVIFNVLTHKYETYTDIYSVVFDPFEGDVGSFRFLDRDGTLLHCFSAHYFYFIEFRNACAVDLIGTHEVTVARLGYNFDDEFIFEPELFVPPESWREAGAQLVDEGDPGAPEVAGQGAALFV